MKKSVLKLTKKDVIHAETLEQANELCKLFDSLGLKKFNNQSYLEANDWETHRESTCYCPKGGEFCYLTYYNKEGYIIHKATDFISVDKDLVEIEITDCELYPEKQEVDLEILKIYLRAKLILAEKYKDSGTANDIIDQLFKYNLI